MVNNALPAAVKVYVSAVPLPVNGYLYLPQTLNQLVPANSVLTFNVTVPEDPPPVKPVPAVTPSISPLPPPPLALSQDNPPEP